MGESYKCTRYKLVPLAFGFLSDVATSQLVPLGQLERGTIAGRTGDPAPCRLGRAGEHKLEQGAPVSHVGWGGTHPGWRGIARVKAGGRVPGRQW